MFAGTARRLVRRLLFWLVAGEPALSRRVRGARRHCAAISLIALLGGLGYAGPAHAQATADPAPAPAPAKPQPAPAGGREVPQLRTEKSRTWVLRDGSYQTREFLHPVNYRDSSGGWQPIDNRLVASAGGWRNKANAYQLSVPSSLSGGAVRLADGAQSVSFTLQGSDAAGSVSGNQATFANALPGVTARWSTYDTAIKEALVLHDAQAATRFPFTVSPSAGLSLKPTRDGGVAVVDGTGAVVFGFQAPFAVDAAGKRAPADAVSLALAPSGTGGSTMTLSIDPSWLQSAGRAFPVTIDPTVDLHPAQDCFLDGEDTTTSFCADPSLWVGWDNDGVLHDHRSLLRFDGLNDSLPATANVLNASLFMYETGQTSPGLAKNLSVHRVTDAWTNDATWTKRDATTNWTTPGGDFADTEEDSEPVVDAGNWMTWTITDLVDQWIDGTDNDGLAMVDDSNQVDNAITFASSDAADQSEWPELEITWWPRVGELPGYTFTSQQLTDRSLAKVNVANGNLLLDNQDLHVAGRDGMDVDIHRYYNSLDPWDGKLGFSWRFNVSEDIIVYDCDDQKGHCLVGPSGYRARFKQRPDGTFITPPGVEKTLVHNSDGTWTMTDHRSGEKWHFFDNSFTFQTSATDRHGNEIDYLTAPPAGLSDIADTRGHDITVTQNADGDATSMEDFDARTWQYGYIPGERILNSVTDPDGHQTQYGYDTQDRLSTITDPRGSVTTIGYDTNDRVATITRQVDANSLDDLTTTYSYHDGGTGATCNKTNEIGETLVTDPRGDTTTYCWDKNGRVLRTIDGAGYETSGSYTPNGDQTSFTDLTGTAAATSTFDFDTNGDDPTNNLKGGTLGAGEQFSVGYCDPSAASGPTQCSSYPEHAFQPISVTGPDNNRFFGYNAAGDVTSIKDSTTSPTNQATLHYNPDGTVDTATDGNGHVTTFGYDSLGQLSSITPDATTGTNTLGVTTYGYDALSRVAQVQDGNHVAGGYQVSNVVYDGEDRMTETDFGDGSYITYTYDGDGNLIQRQDSAGNVTDYSYDRSNRRTSEVFPSNTNTYSYDASGNLATVTDASGTVTYSYDAANRVTTLTQPDLSEITVSYSDPTTRPRTTTVTFPGGVSQTTTTDNSGKTTSIVVKNSAGTTLRSFTYAYGASPNARAQVQSATDQDGRVTSYSYGSVGQLKEADIKVGSTVTERWNYSYDAALNRTEVDHLTASGTTTASYGYNSDNVLCWRYNGTTTSHACDSPPAGASIFAFDPDGNETAGPSSFSAVYDITNRLTTLDGTALGYLSANNTELTAVGATTLTNDLLGVASETNGSGTTYYTRAPDGTLLAQRGASGTQYLIRDDLGSTRGVISGSTIGRDYSYDPDGNSTSSGSGATTDVKFAGGLQAPDGLYHFGRRFYDPGQARWTQLDPIHHVDDLTQIGRYAYAGADPVNNVDPSGESFLRNLVACGSIAAALLACDGDENYRAYYEPNKIELYEGRAEEKFGEEIWQSVKESFKDLKDVPPE